VVDEQGRYPSDKNTFLDPLTAAKLDECTPILTKNVIRNMALVSDAGGTMRFLSQKFAAAFPDDPASTA
jgi:hypothetical protein